MKTRKNTYSLQYTLLLATLLSGCYEPAGERPMEPLPATPKDFGLVEVQSEVEIRDEILYSPLDAQIPADCQQIHYKRYFPRNSALQTPADADALLVLMPGMLGAANTFSSLAEQLVYQGLKQGLNLQIVALNRRSQCLADVAGLNAAEQARDVNVAVDYYYHNASIEGRTFQGFQKGVETRFLTDFGIARAVEDMYQVAKVLVPDQAMRQQKLFIGGHSLGANLTTAFMGWDFDGDARTSDDAGYRQAAGFVRLDISVTPLDATLDPFTLYAANTTSVDSQSDASQRYQREIWKMRNGLLPRVVRFPGVDAETLALLDLAAMLADWAPTEENTLLRELPLGFNPTLMLRLIHSRDLNAFLKNTPHAKDFRYTNEALLGMIMDDNFMPVKILQTSLGFLNGGRVTHKTFPNDPALISLASSISPFFGFILTPLPLFIAGDAGPNASSLGQGPLYGWSNFDEIGSGDYTSVEGTTTFTNARSEVTDIADFARVVYEGSSTFTEWYMPARLTLDFDFLSQSEPVSGLNFWHYAPARDAALLDVVGTESISDISVTPKGELLIAEGYNHMDITTAANDRSARRPNPVIPTILTFMQKHIEQ